MKRWLDFSGAPPLLIAERLVKHWHGTFQSDSDSRSAIDTVSPVTDYDRACQAAWPGRGVLPLLDASVLVLYSEYDLHAWDEERGILACGGWLPSNQELEEANWTDPLDWTVDEANLMLVNSAASGVDSLGREEFINVHLIPGRYRGEYANLEAEFVGIFHRFTRL